MAKRRNNNEGTIFKRDSGKWRAQLSIEGRRLSYTADRKEDVQKWLREITNQVDVGLTSSGFEVSLFAFFEQWLKIVESSKSQTTFNTYSWIIEKRAKRYLKDRKLAELSGETLQQIYRLMSLEGISNHSILQMHKVMSVCFSHGVKTGYLARNPCKGATPPRPLRKEMHFFSREQIKQFLVAVGDWEPENYPFFYMAIHTGMRMSEIIGVQWKDLSNNLIRVNRQVKYFKGQRFKFDAPKSKSGHRTIAIGKMALNVLDTQRAIISDRKKEAETEWDENDLIFPSLVGTPLMPSNVRRTFRRLIKYADLPKIRFHDLRHTAASLMLNNGIPLIIASKRLGHSKPSITLDVYGHLLPAIQEEAAELMDQLVS